MKVTAFIRKTAAKNNITDQARVYFRVRDIGGVDIKAASELSTPEMGSSAWMQTFNIPRNVSQRSSKSLTMVTK